MASTYKRSTRPRRGGQSNAQGAGDSGLIARFTGGLLGSSTSPSYDVNQPVSAELMGEGGGAQQFYSPGGQVTEQPYADTRSWFNRNIRRQPNEAAFRNRELAGQIAEQKAFFPIELQQERQLGALKNQQELARLQGIQELERPYQPVIASTAPGDIDYRLPVDAAAITEGRDISLPYLPVNPESVARNIQFQNQQSEIPYRQAQTKRMLAPERMSIGGALIESPIEGEPRILGQTTGGYDVEEPLVIDPKTGAFTGGQKRHIPQQFRMTPKPVGRINLGGGGIENLGPVYEQPASNAYFPFSGQENEFVERPGLNGGPPDISVSTGGAPTTSKPPRQNYPRIAPGRSSGGISKPEYQPTAPIESSETFLQKLLKLLKQSSGVPGTQLIN